MRNQILKHQFNFVNKILPFHASKSKSKSNTKQFHAFETITYSLNHAPRYSKTLFYLQLFKNHQSSRTPLTHFCSIVSAKTTRNWRTRPKILARSFCQPLSPFPSTLFFLPSSHIPSATDSLPRMFKEHPVFKVCTVGRASEHAFIMGGGGRGTKKSRKFQSACRDNRCHLFVLPLLRFEEKPTGRET